MCTRQQSWPQACSYHAAISMALGSQCVRGSSGYWSAGPIPLHGGQLPQWVSTHKGTALFLTTCMCCMCVRQRFCSALPVSAGCGAFRSLGTMRSVVAARAQHRPWDEAAGSCPCVGSSPLQRESLHEPRRKALLAGTGLPSGLYSDRRPATGHLQSIVIAVSPPPTQPHNTLSLSLSLLPAFCWVRASTTTTTAWIRLARLPG